MRTHLPRPWGEPLLSSTWVVGNRPRRGHRERCGGLDDVHRAPDRCRCARQIPPTTPSTLSRTAADSPNLSRFAAAHETMYGQTPLHALHTDHQTRERSAERESLAK